MPQALEAVKAAERSLVEGEWHRLSAATDWEDQALELWMAEEWLIAKFKGRIAMIYQRRARPDRGILASKGLEVDCFRVQGDRATSAEVRARMRPRRSRNN